MGDRVTDGANQEDAFRLSTGLAGVAMPTALFGLFTFVLMSGGVLGDALLADVEFDDIAYDLREGLKLAGFLLYGALSWLRPRIPFGNAATAPLAVLAALFACCAVVLQVAPSGVISVFAVMAMALLTGFSGGIVYEVVARLAVCRSVASAAAQRADGAWQTRRAATRTLGAAVGIGGAIAVIAQYLLQLRFSLGGWFTALLVACFCFLMYMLDRSLKERNRTLEVSAGSTGDAATRKQVLFLVGVVVCLFALFPFYETALRAAFTSIVFYQWHRLFLVVGYLAIGAAAFLGGRPAMSLVIAIVALFAAFVLAQAALLQADSFTMALFYALYGAVVAYSAIAFMSIAPRTAHPALTASASRMLDGVVTIAGGGAAALAGSWPVSAVLLVALVLIALTTVLMVLGGFFIPKAGFADGAEPAREDPVTTAENRVRALAIECGLTDRERDVLAELVLTEKKNQQIANDMGISRRQVQTYISRIYAKTGTQTRAGLVMRIGADGSRE